MKIRQKPRGWGRMALKQHCVIKGFLHNDIKCPGFKILTAYACQLMQLTPMRDNRLMQFLMLYFKFSMWPLISILPSTFQWLVPNTLEDSVGPDITAIDHWVPKAAPSPQWWSLLVLAWLGKEPRMHSQNRSSSRLSGDILPLAGARGGQ